MNISKKKSKEGKEFSQKPVKTSFLGRMHDDRDLDEKIMSDDGADHGFNLGADAAHHGIEKIQKKKRDKKAGAKKEEDESTGLKVQKLKFSKGSQGLFAISEIHPTYLIVNFTRNSKGFVDLSDKVMKQHSFNKDKLKVG
jgi:ribosomal protein S1